MQRNQFASRLTLYAILSSVETDLRAYVRDYVLHNPLAADPFPPDLRKKLIDRHEQYQGPEQEQLPDDLLLEYTDFSDSHELLMRHKAVLPADVASELDNRCFQLGQLPPIRNRVMHSRPLEPDDFSLTYDFAKSAVGGKVLSWTQLRETMRSMELDPAYVLTLKLPELPWDMPSPVPHNLPLPEFDDTGFIGRVKDRDDLTKLIRGHHQIVTILGEGGVGKTATLVKCLYDLLDSVVDRFDTIVWVSLKNQVLTAGGIKTLRDSITTTLGLYQAIAKPLGATPKDTIGEVLEELRAHLQEYRVLLAIDNLETLQHNELLEFLRDLPPTTKVVITSRIGLWELEIRRALLPMNDAEAAQLFRRFAKELVHL
jgi:LuxR family glucitol operon transcriptional activator